MLSITSSQGWYLHQLDINIMFLHGDLEEDVYMKYPFGLVPPQKGLVCKLKKSFYASNRPADSGTINTPPPSFLWISLNPNLNNLSLPRKII